MQISALMLVKSGSKRLPNKNTLPVNGVPMFVINLRKCLKYFDDVWVSSDSDEILQIAVEEGAIGIKRGEELCGDTPNIPVYRHAMEHMDCDAFIAVQANSPTIDEKIIKLSKDIITLGTQEVMTSQDGKLYGSVWGMTKERLDNYGDPYKPTPDVLIVDNSLDCHTKEDYYEINKFYDNE
jgi:CMP-2-keto-3-deoxyoctulosonic acid synthetase